MSDDELVASLPKHYQTLQTSQADLLYAALYSQRDLHLPSEYRPDASRFRWDELRARRLKAFQMPEYLERALKTIAAVRNLLETRNLCTALVPAPGVPAHLSALSPGQDAAHSVMCGWLAQQAVALQEWVHRLVRQAIDPAPTERLVWLLELEVQNVLQLALKWQGSGTQAGEDEEGEKEQEIETEEESGNASEEEGDAKAAEGATHSDVAEGFDQEHFLVPTEPSGNTFEGSRRVAACLIRALWAGVSGSPRSVALYEAAAWYLSPEARGDLPVEDATGQYLTSRLTTLAAEAHDEYRAHEALQVGSTGSSALTEQVKQHLDEVADTEVQRALCYVELRHCGYRCYYKYHGTAVRLYSTAMTHYRGAARALLASARDNHTGSGLDDNVAHPAAAPDLRQLNLRAARLYETAAGTVDMEVNGCEYMCSAAEYYRELFLPTPDEPVLSKQQRARVTAVCRRNLHTGLRVREGLKESAERWENAVNASYGLAKYGQSDQSSTPGYAYCAELETIALLMEVLAVAKDRLLGVSVAKLHAGLEGELEEGMAEVEALAGRWQTEEAVNAVSGQLQDASWEINAYQRAGFASRYGDAVKARMEMEEARQRFRDIIAVLVAPEGGELGGSGSGEKGAGGGRV